MFKKLIIAAIAILGISAAASARDGYTRDLSVLPTAARTVISDNFKAKISVIKVEKSFGRVSEYEVILNTGCSQDCLSPLRGSCLWGFASLLCLVISIV